MRYTQEEDQIKFKADCCGLNWVGPRYSPMLRFHNADGRVGHKCQNCGAFHANGEGGWKIIFDAEAPAVREAIINAEARRQRLYEAYGGRGQAPRERESPSRRTPTGRFYGTPFPEPIPMPTPTRGSGEDSFERLRNIVHSAQPANTSPERRWFSVDYGEQEFRSQLLAEAPVRRTDPTAYSSVEDRRNNERRNNDHSSPSRRRESFIGATEVANREAERLERINRRRRLSGIPEENPRNVADRTERLRGVDTYERMREYLSGSQYTIVDEPVGGIPPDFYRAMTDAMVYGRGVMEIPRGLGKTGSPFKEEKKKERVNPWLQ